MSRRGGSVYEERYEREESRRPPVRTRERDEEIDINFRRGEREERGSRPAFLRDDYGESRDAGPLVVRERDVETYSRPLERRPRSPSRDVRIRERVVERERSPSPPPPERIRTRIVERERERSPSLPPPERLRARVIETRERIRERSPSPPPQIRVRERYVERERSPSPPPPVRVRERIVERERQRSPSPVERTERIRIRNVEREPSRVPTPEPSPPPSPEPPIVRAPPIHQEIITHHRHIDHGFERAPVPSPPPPRREPPREPPRTKETDIDIYTSRNNREVDITQKDSRSRTPPPEPRPLVRRDSSFYDDTFIYEQERNKLRVQDTRMEVRRRSLSARPEKKERPRTVINFRDDDEDEAEYYRRKTNERAYIGEAYNGATKDWAIVDVPPGTERVAMEGIGGASQEVTWQKYNGVRRSKFNPGGARPREIEAQESYEEPDTRREHIEIRDDSRRSESNLEIDISSRRRNQSTHENDNLDIEISNRRKERGGGSYEREYERIEETTSDRRVGMPRPPPKQKGGDLWTEITKDLVVKEAILEMGYDFEETEFFFYIIKYLRYEDVLELVELSEKIRNERKRHIREIERERERMERRAWEKEDWERSQRRRERDSGFADERIIEREVTYDNRPHRRGW